MHKLRRPVVGRHLDDEQAYTVAGAPSDPSIRMGPYLGEVRHIEVDDIASARDRALRSLQRLSRLVSSYWAEKEKKMHANWTEKA